MPPSKRGPRRLDSADPGFASAFADLLAAKRDSASDVDAIVAAIVEDVKRRGDKAALEYTERFDRVKIAAKDLRVTPAEIDDAAKSCAPATLAALRVAAERIRDYHQRQKPADLDYTDAAGVRLGHRWTPVSAVGIYVPGGTAAYPSSVLMNAVPAKVAGVTRVVMVVPAPDGKLNPLVLAAAKIAGVDEIYRIGGAQAVAALAYGTKTIAAVDKITGPGNAYVAAAKRMVFGEVGIDMIAGPSEVVVVADAQNDPIWIAADLLAQAEHDTAAQSILITDDERFANTVVEAVTTELEVIAARRYRARKLGASWRGHPRAKARRGAGFDQSAGPRAFATGHRRSRQPCRARAARRRHLPGPSHTRGDRRLSRRPQPRAADLAHRALFLWPGCARFHEAHVADRLHGDGVGRAERGSGGAGGSGRAGRPCALDRRAPQPARARRQGKMSDERRRIVKIDLDERTVLRRNPDVEHERAVALFDLLEENHFAASDVEGPYHLFLGIEDNRLVFDVRGRNGEAEPARIVLPITTFRSVVKDYFTICESYYAAIKRSSPTQIEALDMGRRSIHNEGSELLRERLEGKIALDLNTARRLFTLICVLHIRG